MPWVNRQKIAHTGTFSATTNPTQGLGGGWVSTLSQSLIIVTIGVIGAVPSTISVTDNQSNSYTRIGAIGTGTSLGVAIFYSDGSTAGVTTITGSSTAASSVMGLNAAEFTGYAAVSVDTSSNGTTASSSSPSLGPITVAGGTNELVVVVCGQAVTAEQTLTIYTSPAFGVGSSISPGTGGGGVGLGYHIAPTAGSSSIAGGLSVAEPIRWVMGGLLGTSPVIPYSPNPAQVRSQAVNRGANFMKRASDLLVPGPLYIPRIALAG